MTERFTEKMVQAVENNLNALLAELNASFRITRDINNPTGRARMHEILIHNQDTSESQLSRYKQDTANTYLTLKTLYEFTYQMQQRAGKEILASFEITKDDIQQCLNQQSFNNINTDKLTEEELKTIATKAMDYITEDMHKAIADAFDNYIPDTRKEELTK